MLEVHRAQIPPLARSFVLANAHLESAAVRFERERVERLWGLARFDQLALPDVSWREAELVEAMESDGPTFQEMQGAVVRGDVNACQTAARRLHELSLPSVQFRMCAYFTDVVRIEKRVRDAS